MSRRISILTVANCRPQQPPTPENDVEVEKQTVIEVKPLNTNPVHNDKNIEANTKEILEKIAEVNKKHGWTPKRQKPNYFQFPFSYFKSESEKGQDRQRSDFKFSNNPFSNPIFDYLEKENQKTQHQQFPNNHDITTRQSMDPEQHGYEISMTNPNAEVTADDVIPGQYVKRKIVHQQTILVPNPNYVASPMAAMVPPNMPPNFGPLYAPQVPLMNIPFTEMEMSKGYNNTGNKVLNHLEKQTIDNIKNIVSNSQALQTPNPAMYYPYQQLPNPNLNVPAQVQYGFMDPSGTTLGQMPNNYQLYGPYSLAGGTKGRQNNWNWPGSGYFPIHIRDPFLQMYNAFTSMVEYGPGAGNVNPCPGKPTRNNLKNDLTLREAKTTDSTQLIPEESRHFESLENALTTTESDEDYFSIENVDVSTSEESHINILPTNKNRVAKDTETEIKEWEKIKMAGKAIASVVNNTRLNSKIVETRNDFEPIHYFKISRNKTEPVISPPKRDPTQQTIEFGEEESDKSDDIISNDGNKKFFSRDNTGSGVFINKLKVRKGGVAIAGPGGIATAGSGGTAIVGPNGVAYTHPDSLAIAGSGTKVVAVDPNINLADIIKHSANARNQPLSPSRVGKVVAVGPVVYYNKG